MTLSIEERVEALEQRLARDRIVLRADNGDTASIAVGSTQSGEPEIRLKSADGRNQVVICASGIWVLAEGSGVGIEGRKQSDGGSIVYVTGPTWSMKQPYAAYPACLFAGEKGGALQLVDAAGHQRSISTADIDTLLPGKSS